MEQALAISSKSDVVMAFFDRVIKSLETFSLELSSKEPKNAKYFQQGFDVVSWCRNTSEQPSDKYLASSPISFPLILLTQSKHMLSFLNLYLLVCVYMLSSLSSFSSFSSIFFSTISFLQKLFLIFFFFSSLQTLQVLNFVSFLDAANVLSNPGKLSTFLNSIDGTSGHSQGLIASVVIASSTNSLESLMQRTEEACKFSLLLGTRGQQIADTLYKEVEQGLPPMLVAGRQSARGSRARKQKRKPPVIDTVSVGEATFMLSVRGVHVGKFFSFFFLNF